MPIYNAPILAVDPVETRRYAGLQKAEDFKQELIDNACQEAQLLIQPKGIWQIYDYDAESQTVYNQDPVPLRRENTAFPCFWMLPLPQLLRR